MTDTTTTTTKPADPGIPDNLNRRLNHEYPLHPLTAMFPLMEARVFASLVADIEANGLIEPITLKDGAILDGRNRYSACKTARYQFKAENFVELPKDQDPLVFVISKNIQRRHLTVEQKREVIAKLLEKQPNASSRAIASIARCSHHTVEAIRNAAESTPAAAESEPTTPTETPAEPTGQPAQLRTGQDGRKRKSPAKRSKSKQQEAKELKKQVDDFIAEWPNLNEWQQNYFVRKYKDEIAEILATIEALQGEAEKEVEEQATAAPA